ELVVPTDQPRSAVAFVELVFVEIEEFAQMRAGLHASNRRKLEGLPPVGPIAAAAPAFRRAVPEEKAVAEPILSPADGDVHQVLSRSDGLAGAPSDGGILGTERRDVRAVQFRGGPVRALTDDAQLAVNLAR